MYILCIYYVYIMYILCIYYVYICVMWCFCCIVVEDASLLHRVGEDVHSADINLVEQVKERKEQEMKLREIQTMLLGSSKRSNNNSNNSNNSNNNNITVTGRKRSFNSWNTYRSSIWSSLFLRSSHTGVNMVGSRIIFSSKCIHTAQLFPTELHFFLLKIQYSTHI